MVVFDSVLSQIENQPVNKRVASGQHPVAVMCQCDSILLCQGSEIGEYLLDHRGKLDPVVTHCRLQTAHFKKSLRHLRQPLDLFPQKREKFRSLWQNLRMLVTEKLYLRLHERQWRSQLVRSVSGELLLRLERALQSLEHIVERAAELSELG